MSGRRRNLIIDGKGIERARVDLKFRNLVRRLKP